MRAASARTNMRTAIVVALALFAQSVLSAWSASAMVAQPMFDGFGNPLCVTVSDDAGGTSDHSRLPVCCTFGCASAATMLPVPEADGISESPIRAPIRLGSASSALIPAPATKYDPGNPRAPPVAV
jgi:hypothetical protein